MQSPSSEVCEKWLKSEEAVWVEKAVDGLLDSYSGLDSKSESLHVDPVDQSGKLGTGSDRAKSNAGVFGGEKTRE